MDHYNHSNNNLNLVGGSNNKKPEMEFAGGNQEQQQMTIFYGGQICVCPVTESQAKEIIWRAGRDMDERRQVEMGLSSSSSSSPSLSQPTYPCLRPPSINDQTPQGLSMKKSLQQFLEKRRQLHHSKSLP
ncbi:hypothetical protein MLD38_021216 [Melastoma candidum]|uniref:Uncharacterized protein n=1 Tax=Melastoma candidum TaxID=119954 RepID=A0ACB9QIT2_9MYRT|nr:hypothetical protein MLD38_021216 [Melastoma candidum]